MPSISLLVQVAAFATYPCGCSQLLSHPDELVASQILEVCFRNYPSTRKHARLLGLRRCLDQLKVGATCVSCRSAMTLGIAC